jgi:hypothetical protein
MVPCPVLLSVVNKQRLRTFSASVSKATPEYNGFFGEPPSRYVFDNGARGYPRLGAPLGPDIPPRESNASAQRRARALAPGWTTIQSTSRGIEYWNAGTGGTAIGEIDSAGNHITK